MQIECTTCKIVSQTLSTTQGSSSRLFILVHHLAVGICQQHVTHGQVAKAQTRGTYMHVVAVLIRYNEQSSEGVRVFDLH